MSDSAIALDAFSRDAVEALRIVRQAMGVSRSIEHRVTAATKLDRSPVTIVDLAVQAIVSAGLARAFPGDVLVAEEDSVLLRGHPAARAEVMAAVRDVIPQASLSAVTEWIDRGASAVSPRFWVLDPIDGTKGFVNGRQYATALALVEDGAVVLSIVGCPRLSLAHVKGSIRAEIGSARGGLAFAIRHGGAWWHPSDEMICWPLSVSLRRDPAVARIAESFEPLHGDPARLSRILHALGTGVPTLLMDSQVKHVAIAAGVTDLLLRLPPSQTFHDAIWDQAPGALLVEEAGGRVTDLAGRALDFSAGRQLRNNVGVVASNGHLHAAALDAVQWAH